ncbi:MAG: MSMEG_0570 family nitrogen starvation response protein [Corynebacterium sp.]|uniref:MSMEG_0570 family nitrogen starvation response protein n=1 Tax=Corynebacterium sp. TaxID=1720 RepID=UPI003F98A256
MPEMSFTVRWPDGTQRSYYSPSLVVHDHLTTGADYTVDDFVQRSTTAMTRASDRVRAKFGVACTSAAETTARIHADAGRWPGGGDAVRVTALEPPLPS